MNELYYSAKIANLFVHYLCVEYSPHHILMSQQEDYEACSAELHSQSAYTISNEDRLGEVQEEMEI